MAEIEFGDRSNYVTMANSDFRDVEKLAMAKVEFSFRVIDHIACESATWL